MSDGLLFRNQYRISSSQRIGWDYRRPGVYGVTVCVAIGRAVWAT